MKILMILFISVFLVGFVLADINFGFDDDKTPKVVIEKDPVTFNNITFGANTTVTDSWTRTGTDVHLTNIGDNVGIGTSTPAHKLNLIGRLNISNGFNDKLIFEGTNSDPHTIFLSGNQGMRIYDDDNLELIRLTETGLFGIGTSAPTHELNVDGDVNFSGGFFWDSANGRLGVGTSTPEYIFHTSGGSNAMFEYTSSDTDRLRTAFRVKHKTDQDMTDGFGATALFNVEDDTSGVVNIARFSASITNSEDNSGKLRFEPYNSGIAQDNALVVDYTGNVGLGIETPLTALHIPDDKEIGFGTNADVKIGHQTGLMTDGGLEINLTGVDNSNLHITTSGDLDLFSINGEDGRVAIGGEHSSGNYAKFYVQKGSLTTNMGTYDAMAVGRTQSDSDQYGRAIWGAVEDEQTDAVSSNAVMGLNAFVYKRGNNSNTHSIGLVAGRYGVRFQSGGTGNVTNTAGVKSFVSSDQNPTSPFTITHASAFWAEGIQPKGSGSNFVTINNSYNFLGKSHVQDGDAVTTNAYGIFLEKQSIGTNNYGIVLDGDGAGSDILFGASQDASVDFDGSALNFNAEVGSPDVTFTGFDNFGIGTSTPTHKLNIVGNQNLTGNFSGNQYYGEMWFHNDSENGQPTQIDSAGSWYNISFGFVQVGESGGSNNGFTFDSNANGSLITEVGGLYKLDYTISFGHSGGASREFKIGVAIDDVIQENTEVHRVIGTSGDVGNAGGSGFITLVPDEVVTLQIQNQDGTEDGEVHSANLNLIRIGT